LRSAVFRTEKTNAREADPNNPLQNILSGNQRVNGFEMEFTGHLTSRWQIMSSYALLDSRVVKSLANPATIGSRLANAPRNTASVWTTCGMPWKMTVGGGAQYVGARTASSTVPLDPVTGRVKEAPGYLVFNAMARRPISDRLDLQINLNNLTNKYYFDQLHPAHVIPGAGRSALIGLNLKF
jgi:catecholate siderophore receptor